MVGVPVRVHDLTGEGLGIAHIPPAVELGDFVALEHSEYRVVVIGKYGLQGCLPYEHSHVHYLLERILSRVANAAI